MILSWHYQHKIEFVRDLNLDNRGLERNFIMKVACEPRDGSHASILRSELSIKVLSETLCGDVSKAFHAPHTDSYPKNQNRINGR